MGNRLNDVKPLRKNQARQALLSGEAGKGGVFAMQEAVTVIRIPLIQINHLLLFDITKGDSVKIRWKDGSFFTNSGSAYPFL